MLKKILLLTFIVFFSSCATYHLSKESLLEQFANVHPQEKKTLFIAFPIFIPFQITGNDIQEVKCFDKNEKEVILQVTRHTGIRITRKDKTYKTFMFDTLKIKDSLINGSQSNLFNLNIIPINLNDIEKIELQK